MIGVAYKWSLEQLWRLYSEYVHITNWLNETLGGARDDMAFHIAATVHDAVVNLLFTLPFAMLIAKLTPRFNWIYLTVSFAFFLILEYWFSIVRPVTFLLSLQNGALLFYHAVTISALPLAFFLITLMKGKIR